MIRSLFLVLLLACCLPACAGFMAAHDVDFENADRFFNEKKYSDAITAYDKIANDSPRSKRGARALYDIAFTRAFYDNPHKDYAQALQDFDEFLRVYPNDKKARDAQNWRHLIRMVLELKKENEHLLQSIDELKKIDIRHEERRRK